MASAVLHLLTLALLIGGFASSKDQTLRGWWWFAIFPAYVVSGVVLAIGAL